MNSFLNDKNSTLNTVKREIISTLQYDEREGQTRINKLRDNITTLMSTKIQMGRIAGTNKQTDNKSNQRTLLSVTHTNSINNYAPKP